MRSLIGPDIELMRNRYDEALILQGVPAQYQFPHMADSNDQGEPVIDSYSDMQDTHIFFEGSPKLKTFKRLGWVVENDSSLPFLIHASWNLPSLQKDSIFRTSGMYTGMPDRMFRVTELTTDIQAPDHVICQVVPVYGNVLPVGRTKKEIQQTYSSSSHFLKPNADYNGTYQSEKPGER
jgi:hypothetical protein